MAKKPEKRQTDKQMYTEHNTVNLRLNNTNPTKTRRVNMACTTCGTRYVARISTNSVISLIL